MTTTASISRMIIGKPEALSACEDFAAFCDMTGQAWAKSYIWAEDIFQTCKHNPYTDGSYKALLFPRARKFSDLFEAAIFDRAYSGPGNRVNGTPINRQPGFHLISTLEADGAAFSGNMGGKRYVRVFHDGTAVRGHGAGTHFYVTSVKPRQEVIERVSSSLISAIGSFSAVRWKPSGAILITVRDNHGIGERWLAALDPDATADEIMPPEQIAYRDSEFAAMKDDWACIVKRDDGREYLDESKCNIEVRRG